MSASYIFSLLTATFVTALVIANLMGSLLLTVTIPFFGPVIVSGGIIAFPITFLLTDLINEFYGTQGARYTTALGFLMAILVFAVLWLAQQGTPLQDSPLPKSAFSSVFANYAGMFIASLAAYVVGQLLDISLFQGFKKITGSKLIWLRATGSTLISQGFDSFIVSFVAFYGDLPVDIILKLAQSGYWIKFTVAILITPLLYFGHSLLSKAIRPVPPKAA